MKSKYLLLLLFLLSITFISAAPPFQQGVATSGIQIETAIFQSIKANQPFEFYIHAFNKTDGVIIPNTDLNCTLELINSSGVHTLNVNMTPRINGVDMEYEANSTEIKEGSYVTFIYCHLISEPTIGDFINYNFDITTNGSNGANNILFFIIILILGYGLNLLGFFNKNSTITILGGIILTFVGFYMIQNGIIIYRDNLTLAISYITLFWGIGSSLWAAIEEIQDTL